MKLYYFFVLYPNSSTLNLYIFSIQLKEILKSKSELQIKLEKLQRKEKELLNQQEELFNEISAIKESKGKSIDQGRSPSMGLAQRLGLVRSRKRTPSSLR